MKQIIAKDYKTFIDLSDWQKINGLKSNQITKNITLDFDNILCESELLIAQDILECFDKIRAIYGKPIKINSGYRTQKRQDELTAEGYRTAKTSPHCQGFALDLGFNPGEGLNLLQAVKEVVHNYLGLIRFGYKQYWDLKQNFIHVDCAPIASLNIPGNIFPEVWKLKNVVW